MQILSQNMAVKSILSVNLSTQSRMLMIFPCSVLAIAASPKPLQMVVYLLRLCN